MAFIGQNFPNGIRKKLSTHYLNPTATICIYIHMHEYLSTNECIRLKLFTSLRRPYIKDGVEICISLFRTNGLYIARKRLRIRMCNIARSCLDRIFSLFSQTLPCAVQDLGQYWTYGSSNVFVSSRTEYVTFRANISPPYPQPPRPLPIGRTMR